MVCCRSVGHGFIEEPSRLFSAPRLNCAPPACWCGSRKGGPSGSLLTACAALLQRPRAPYTETGRHSTDPVPSRPPAWTPMGGSADACATGQRRNVTGLLRPAAPPSQTVHPGRNQRAFSPVAVRLMLAEDPGFAGSCRG